MRSPTIADTRRWWLSRWRTIADTPAAEPPPVFAAEPPGDGPLRVVSDSADPCLKFRLERQAAADRCLPPGTLLRIRQEEGEWSRVVLRSGREGWMATSFLATRPAAGS